MRLHLVLFHPGENRNIDKWRKAWLQVGVRLQGVRCWGGGGGEERTVMRKEGCGENEVETDEM